MGGLSPGIGGLEILVIGLLALIVVGPKDLPVLLRDALELNARLVLLAEELEVRPGVFHRRVDFDRDIDETEAQRACPECTCHVVRCSNRCSSPAAG